MLQRHKILLSIASILGLVSLLSAPIVYAGTLTAVTDTMSRQKTSTKSSHVIKFTTPTVLDVTSSGSTIVIAFPSGFDNTSGAIGDVTMTDGPTTGAENTETLAASPSATAWGAVWTDGACGSGLKCTLTLTNPTDGVGAHDIIATEKVIITISNTHMTNPSSAGSKTITITTTSDSASFAVPIVATTDDAEVVTATVAPSITFSNDDNAIGFGTLSTSAATYANAGATGSGSDTTAHTMVITTNAPSGYSLTYNGATLTLTGSSPTISVATITSDADGTPGSEQFAISGALTGTGSMDSAYNNATPNWKFIASTATTLASYSAPTASDSIAMHYLANIAGTTEAGAYSTTINYEATGNF